MTKKNDAAVATTQKTSPAAGPPPPGQQAPHESAGPGVGALFLGLTAVAGGGLFAVRSNETANRFARENLPGLYSAVNQVLPLDMAAPDGARAEPSADDMRVEAAREAEEPPVATIDELEAQEEHERHGVEHAPASEGEGELLPPADDTFAAVAADAAVGDDASTEVAVAGADAADAADADAPPADGDSADAAEPEGTPVDVGGDAGDVEPGVELPDVPAPEAPAPSGGLSPDIAHEVERLRVEALRESAEHTQALLRREMDASVERELAGMDEGDLRARVRELSRQLHDISRLEGVRLNEALRQQEERLADRYLALLRAQGAAARDRLHAATRDVHASAEAALNEELRRRSRELREEAEAFVAARAAEAARAAAEREERVRAEAQLAAADEFSATLERAAREFAGRDAARQRALSALRTEINALSSVFGWHNDYERFSHEVHRVSLASLAIAQALETQRPLGPALVYLRAAARQDTTLTAVLRSLPREAELRGVQTRTALAARFRGVKTRVRSAIYAHPGAGGLGRAVGRATVALLAEPEPEPEALSDLLLPLAAGLAGPGAANAAVAPAPAMLAASPKQDGAGEEAEAAAEEEEEEEEERSEAASAVATASMAAADADSPEGQQQQQRQQQQAGAAEAGAAAAARKERESAAAEAERVAKRVRLSRRWEQEQRVAHAAAFLEKGDLRSAVQVLNGLNGSARETLQPWIDDAKMRLAVEQTLRVVRAHATCLAASLN